MFYIMFLRYLSGEYKHFSMLHNSQKPCCYYIEMTQQVSVCLCESIVCAAYKHTT